MARKRVTRRQITLAGLAVVVLGGVLWAGSKVLYARAHETTDDAQLEGHIIPVAAKVSGFIGRIYVDDNQMVQPGDTLFTLDARDYQVRLDQAVAEQAAAEAAAQDGGASAGVAAASAQRRAAQANIEAAEAAFERARRDYQRLQGLAAKDIASKAQLDAAEAAYRAASASLSAARDQARGSSAGVTGARAQLRAADARLAAARAAVEAARLQLSYTVVTASTGGRVSKKSVEAGQFVQPGQPLLSLVDEQDVWVVANLKETQLGDVRPGQPVDVTVDAYGGHVFHGRVQSVQAATGAKFALLPPDNATGNFTKVVQRVPVKIQLRGDDGYRLRPGLSAYVAIDTRAGAPSAAVASESR